MSLMIRIAYFLMGNALMTGMTYRLSFTDLKSINLSLTDCVLIGLLITLTSLLIKDKFGIIPAKFTTNDTSDKISL